MTKTLILPIIVLVPIVATLIACNSEQKQEVTTYIRKSACETVAAQKPEGDTPEQAATSASRIIGQTGGCEAGVMAVLKIADDLIAANKQVNFRDLFELGLAWCLETYSSQPFPGSGISRDELLGCMIGIEEAPLYSERIRTAVDNEVSANSMAMEQVQKRTNECLYASADPQKVVQCFNGAPMTPEQMNEVVRVLRTSHRELQESGKKAVEETRIMQGEITTLRQQIDAEGRKRWDLLATVADLDLALRDTQTYNSQRSADEQRSRSAKLDELNLPGQISAANARIVAMGVRVGSLKEQTKGLRDDLKAALLAKQNAESELTLAKRSYDNAVAEERERKKKEAEEAAAAQEERAAKTARGSPSDSGSVGYSKSSPTSQSPGRFGGTSNRGSDKSSPPSSSPSRFGGGSDSPSKSSPSSGTKRF